MRLPPWDSGNTLHKWWDTARPDRFLAAVRSSKMRDLLNEPVDIDGPGFDDWLGRLSDLRTEKDELMLEYIAASKHLQRHVATHAAYMLGLQEGRDGTCHDGQ